MKPPKLINLLFVSHSPDPKVSSYSEKVSSIKVEQLLSFENDVGIYLDYYY